MVNAFRAGTIVAVLAAARRLVHGAAPAELRRPHPGRRRVPRRGRRGAARHRRARTATSRSASPPRWSSPRVPRDGRPAATARSRRSSARCRRSRSPAASCSSRSTTASSTASTRCCSAASSASPTTRCSSCSLVGAAALAVLAVIGRPLLFASIDPDVAAARGVPVRALSSLFLVAARRRRRRGQPDHRRAAGLRAARRARGHRAAAHRPAARSASCLSVAIGLRHLGRARASRTTRPTRSGSGSPPSRSPSTSSPQVGRWPRPARRPLASRDDRCSAVAHRHRLGRHVRAPLHAQRVPRRHRHRRRQRARRLLRRAAQPGLHRRRAQPRRVHRRARGARLRRRLRGSACSSPPSPSALALGAARRPRPRRRRRHRRRLRLDPRPRRAVPHASTPPTRSTGNGAAGVNVLFGSIFGLSADQGDRRHRGSVSASVWPSSSIARPCCSRASTRPSPLPAASPCGPRLGFLALVGSAPPRRPRPSAPAAPRAARRTGRRRATPDRTGRTSRSGCPAPSPSSRSGRDHHQLPRRQRSPELRDHGRRDHHLPRRVRRQRNTTTRQHRRSVGVGDWVDAPPTCTVTVAEDTWGSSSVRAPQQRRSVPTRTSARLLVPCLATFAWFPRGLARHVRTPNGNSGAVATLPLVSRVRGQSPCRFWSARRAFGGRRSVRT